MANQSPAEVGDLRVGCPTSLCLRGTAAIVGVSAYGRIQDGSEAVAAPRVSGIGVLGSTPITFTEYGIDNPWNPGVSLEDVGIVEFVLVVERG